MSNAHEQPQSAARSIFDSHHYDFQTRSPHSDGSGAFDSNPVSRRPSAQTTSTQNASVTTHNANDVLTSSHLAYVDEFPSETNSTHSNSSSLRQTYAALRGGIFPPGMRGSRRLPSQESSSEASHYGPQDDEDPDDDVSYNLHGEGPFQHPDSPMRAGNSADVPIDEDDGVGIDEDVYANALNKPDVPLRRSSAFPQHPVSAISPAVMSSLRRSSGSSSTSSSTRSADDAEPLRAIAPPRKSSQNSLIHSLHKRSVPSIGEQIIDKDRPPMPQTAPLSPVKRSTPLVENDESELQKRIEAEAYADDSGRPKTLKEARAMAKERARIRSQAKEVSDQVGIVPAALPQSPPKSATHQRRESNASDAQRQENRQAQIVPLTDAMPSGNVAVLAGSSSGIRRPSVSGSDARRPSIGSQHSRRPSGATSGVHGRRPSMPHIDITQADRNGGSGADADGGAFGDMSELQAAVGEALQDVSFASATTSTTNTTVAPRPAAPETTLKAYMSSSVEKGSNSASVASFDSAPESPTAVSPYSSAVQLPATGTATTAAPMQAETSTDDALPHIPVIHSAKGTVVDPMATPTLSQGVHQQRDFQPHALHSQQRATAPNKIARLDVYGKTVPWPAAFDPTAITEQRRLAPWERARSYAHYCNDLMKTSTGLEVWIDMVQRPAQRIAAGTATPTTRHVKEGTENSGYAASVRSDATFPVRGDGGKAKEIVSQQPAEASIPESPGTVPQNLPYPSLARGQAQQVQSRHQTRPSQDSIDQQKRDPTKNFFSSLGRRNSTRQSPMGKGFSTNATGGRQTAGNIRSRGISVPQPQAQPAQAAAPAARTPASDATITPNEVFITPVTSPAPVAPAPAPGMTASSSTASLSRGGLQGPRPLGNNVPSYFGSRTDAGGGGASIRAVSRSPNQSQSHDRAGLHGLGTTGGIYSVPLSKASPTQSDAPTDYTNERNSPAVSAAPLPASASVKNSLSYASVRSNTTNNDGNNGGGGGKRPSLAPPLPQRNVSGGSSDSSGGSGENRNSSQSISEASVKSGGGGSGPFRLRKRGSNAGIGNAPPTAEENAALDKLEDVLPDAERSSLLEYLRRANGNDLVAIGDYLQDQSKFESSKFMR